MRQNMTVGSLIELLKKASDNSRYAAGRIRALEKKASDAETALKESTVAQTLVRAGVALDDDDARAKLKKLAGRDPVDLVGDVVRDPMNMFETSGSSGSAPRTDDDAMNPLLTNKQALSFLRDGE